MAVACVLAACSGGSGEQAAGATDASVRRLATADTAMGRADAIRLAQQASFGPNESLIADMQGKSVTAWLGEQMALRASWYARGNGDAIHKHTVNGTEFCDLPANAGPNCWRDWYSTQPLLWDFYRNAVYNGDQLRQRVAYALGQWLVVSGVEVDGTYGHRNYQNMLLDMAFGNYRELLRRVALSPVMGDYLSNVNSDKAAPNENFARELLQLFSVGTCELNADGTLREGRCIATYNNETVRNYAFALTGWTYPPGGATAWGCWPEGTNCTYYNGDMVAVDGLHDKDARPLLAGQSVPAGASTQVALDRVLDSLMAHPNTAPFVARQLIQHLVTSNPSPAYVQRVATAFSDGSHAGFGAGSKGDLAATVAAVLLDPEARTASPARSFGRLREPVLLITGVLRAFGGSTDGQPFGWWWGELLRQHMFRSPSVFNFYPPDFPVAGTPLVGPAFGIHNASSALERLNYLAYLFYWGGSSAEGDVPDALATRVDLQPLQAQSDDAGALVDRIAGTVLPAGLPVAARAEAVRAVEAFTPQTAGDSWREQRVRTAAYMVFGSPQYQIIR